MIGVQLLNIRVGYMQITFHSEYSNFSLVKSIF